MAVTAALVKELRERTGAGMMDCKKALTETNGDIDLAIENMRKSGAAKAAKKAGNIAAEGTILIKQGEGFTALLEVNCQTDFVAKDENFLGFANTVLDAAAAAKTDIETLKAQFEDTRVALVAKIGENINVRRVEYLAESVEWRIIAQLIPVDFTGQRRRPVDESIVPPVRGFEQTFAPELLDHRLIVLQRHQVGNDRLVGDNKIPGLQRAVDSAADALFEVGQQIAHIAAENLITALAAEHDLAMLRRQLRNMILRKRPGPGHRIVEMIDHLANRVDEIAGANGYLVQVHATVLGNRFGIS